MVEDGLGAALQPNDRGPSRCAVGRLDSNNSKSYVLSTAQRSHTGDRRRVGPAHLSVTPLNIGRKAKGDRCARSILNESEFVAIYADFGDFAGDDLGSHGATPPDGSDDKTNSDQNQTRNRNENESSQAC